MNNQLDRFENQLDRFDATNVGTFDSPFTGELFPPPPAPPPLPALEPVVAPVFPVPSYGGGAAACFSTDVEVQTPSGPKTMDEVRIGDLVLTMEHNVLQFSPVESFLHRLPEKKVAFRRIVCTDGSSVTLTAEHFIYVLPCESPEGTKAIMKSSKNVKVGEDCLIKVSQSENKQKRIQVESNCVVMSTGAYSPLTENGNIITNNIFASCHSVFQNKVFMDAFSKIATSFKEGFCHVFGISNPEDVMQLPWLVQWGFDCFDSFILAK